MGDSTYHCLVDEILESPSKQTGDHHDRCPLIEEPGQRSNGLLT